MHTSFLMLYFITDLIPNLKGLCCSIKSNQFKFAKSIQYNKCVKFDNDMKEFQEKLVTLSPDQIKKFTDKLASSDVECTRM